MYREAHTLDIAEASASEFLAGMLPMESYKPAPDMPAKSSTLAEDRTMRVAFSPK